MGEGKSADRTKEKIYIEVKDPTISVVPCAIPPLAQAPAGVLDDIRKKLAEDLEFSGLLKPIPNVPPLAPPELTGEFRYSWWRDLGADVVVAVDLDEAPGNPGYQFYAFDTILGAKILERKLSGAWQDATNEFMNGLVERLSGKPGIFRTRIALVGKVSGAKEIFVGDWDGRNFKQITRNHSLNLAPAWDSDGRRLLFTSYIRRNPDLYVYELNPGTMEVLSSFPGLNYGAEMSPDGKRIALTITKARNSDVYVLDIDKTSIERITDHPAIDSSPTWSPDGKMLAFVSDRSGTPQIYTMPAVAGGEATRLTFETTQNDYPAWSPDGSFIAYSGLAPEGRFQVYLVSTDGWTHKRLTTAKANHEFPSWAPDGRHLVYTSDKKGKDHLVLIMRDVLAGVEREVDPSVRISGWPAWSPARGR
ncbi:MAG: PD40 domain-containing protein [Nitrospirae bacterium]|nr:PD40 domain-containing protein [Nitrospirota bacterium]